MGARAVVDMGELLMSIKAKTIEQRLARIERHLLEQFELQLLGHRIIYDVKTGRSRNMPGCSCDPKLLDAAGYQVRI